MPETIRAKPSQPRHRAGTYVACSACGRLLRIDWPTRSIVCSCGGVVKAAKATAGSPEAAPATGRGGRAGRAQRAEVKGGTVSSR